MGGADFHVVLRRAVPALDCSRIEPAGRARPERGMATEDAASYVVP
jgi:hypothetical protein